MIPVPAECPCSPEVCVRRWKTVIPCFDAGACGKKREMGSLNERRCCERSLRIAAAVNPLVIEPMLNPLERVSGLPVLGEYAFSRSTEVSLATSTTPEKPLSACARTTASSRAGFCATMRAAGKSSSSRTRRLFIASYMGRGTRYSFLSQPLQSANGKSDTCLGIASPGELRNERERGKYHGREARLDVNRARLTLNLLHLGGVGHLPVSYTHLTLTARCESHSRLVARLEDAERANVEREKERKPPHQRCVDDDEEHRDHHADTRRHDSEDKPLVPFTRANVGDARRRRLHWRPRPGC